jgi:hypothetical protein
MCKNIVRSTTRREQSELCELEMCDGEKSRRPRLGNAAFSLAVRSQMIRQRTEKFISSRDHNISRS